MFNYAFSRGRRQHASWIKICQVLTTRAISTNPHTVTYIQLTWFHCNTDYIYIVSLFMSCQKIQVVATHPRLIPIKGKRDFHEFSINSWNGPAQSPERYEPLEIPDISSSKNRYRQSYCQIFAVFATKLTHLALQMALLNWRMTLSSASVFLCVWSSDKHSRAMIATYTSVSKCCRKCRKEHTFPSPFEHVSQNQCTPGFLIWTPKCNLCRHLVSHMHLKSTNAPWVIRLRVRAKTICDCEWLWPIAKLHLRHWLMWDLLWKNQYLETSHKSRQIPSNKCSDLYTS